MLGMQDQIILHNSILLEPRNWAKRVPAGNILVDTLFPAVSWDYLLTALEHYRAQVEKHILFVVDGHGQLEPLKMFLSSRYDMACSIPDGYADIVAFQHEWNSAWLANQLVVVTGPTLIHVLAHGLLSFDHISLIIFDDITRAQRGHPFCLSMRYFYAPIRTRELKALEAESISFATHPRVLAFALLPPLEDTLLSDNIVSRKSWILRLQSYRNDFYCSILTDFRAALDMPLSESIFDTLRTPSIKVLSSTQATKPDPNVLYFDLSDSSCVDRFLSGHAHIHDSDVMLSHRGAFSDDIAEAVYSLIERLSKEANNKRTLYLVPDHGQSQLSNVLANRLLQGPFSSLFVGKDEELRLGLVNAKHQWHDLFGSTVGALLAQKNEYLKLSSGAALLPEIALDMLLRFCSAFPRFEKLPYEASHVAMKTVLVKVNDNCLPSSPQAERGVRFVSRLRLPTILLCKYPSLPFHFDGLISHTKSLTQRSAAISACNSLLAVGALDGHLMISGQLREWLQSLVNAHDSIELPTIPYRSYN